MPLKKGHSDAVVSHNISEMVKAGHPHAQAVAASMRMADESKKKHKDKKAAQKAGKQRMSAAEEMGGEEDEEGGTY